MMNDDGRDFGTGDYRVLGEVNLGPHNGSRYLIPPEAQRRIKDYLAKFGLDPDRDEGDLWFHPVFSGDNLAVVIRVRKSREVDA